MRDQANRLSLAAPPAARSCVHGTSRYFWIASAGVAVELHGAVVDDDRAGAELEDRRQVVRDEHQRDAARDQLAHPLDALVLERGVADAQHLVDEQDVGIEVGGDREAEPRVHAGRVALDLGVDELADAGELDDLVELAARSRRASSP